jgi:hypothetical protein
MNALYTLGRFHDGAVGPQAMTLQEMMAIAADLSMQTRALTFAPKEMDRLEVLIRENEMGRNPSLPNAVQAAITARSSFEFAQVVKTIQGKLGLGPKSAPKPDFPSWMIPVAAALTVGMVLMSNPRE